MQGATPGVPFEARWAGVCSGPAGAMAKRRSSAGPGRRLAAKTCFGYLFLWGFGGGCLFLISGVREIHLHLSFYSLLNILYHISYIKVNI